MTAIRRIAAAFIVVLVAAMIVTPVSANGTVGNFEVDGNSKDDSGSGDPIDWATPPPALTPFTDLVKSNKDNAFGQGSKELEPGGWTCVQGGVPPKDDISRGAIAFRDVAGKQYVYANWVRASTNGDAHVDYEFNQSNAAGPCPGVPKRTNGDVLMTFDTVNGGKTISVRAFSWQFTGPGVGVFNQFPGTAENVTFDAAVNIPPSLSDPGLAAGAFGELSLNLTDTIGTITCGEFAGVYLKTRASSEINSALKDRTLSKPLNIAKCDPLLKIAKAAGTSSVAQGGAITYTITYSNTGTGPADKATITDTVPSGSAITGCTGGCTISGRTATWQVGPVPPGGGGSVTLTVRVDSVPANCKICNTASISSPQFNSGAPVVSAPACVTITPSANATNANANGSANGLVIAAGLPIDGTTGTSSSSQSGPGSPSDADVHMPVDASPAAKAGIITTSSSSSVSAADGAEQTSSAETANVNVAGGVVTASAVRAVASTTATGSSSSISSEGSWIKDLVVDPDGPGGTLPPMNNVAPNTRIDVSEAFGPGSYVKIYERTGSTDGPDAGTLSGGTYVADLTVNMIHVFLFDMDSLLPGAQSAEVIVSQAIAHSDFPQTQLCVAGPEQSVSGNASILEETTTPSLLPVVVGFVEIPSTGGASHQHVDSLFVEGVATGGAADSDSLGTTDSDSSDATSYAEVGRVCLLPSGGTCVVSATAVRSQANSSATAAGASSSDDGTVFVDLEILGTPVGDTPAPNTQFQIPGVGTITLNRQFCDSGGTPDDGCKGTSSTGLTVQAIHILVSDPMLPISTEIVVAEAHSDALYVA